MKKTQQHWHALALLLLLAAVVSGCISSYNHKTPEKLGKTVFKLLKNQDQAGIQYVIPTESDLESYLATADMPEDELAAFQEEMKQIINEFAGVASTSFQTSSDVASSEGVVLSKAKLGDIHAETWQGPDNELANIHADVTYNGKKYLLQIENAGKVASGWVLSMEGFSFSAVKE